MHCAACGSPVCGLWSCGHSSTLPLIDTHIRKTSGYWTWVIYFQCQIGGGRIGETIDTVTTRSHSPLLVFPLKWICVTKLLKMKAEETNRSVRLALPVLAIPLLHLFMLKQSPHHRRPAQNAGEYKKPFPISSCGDRCADLRPSMSWLTGNQRVTGRQLCLTTICH